MVSGFGHEFWPLRKYGAHLTLQTNSLIVPKHGRGDEGRYYGFQSRLWLFALLEVNNGYDVVLRR